VSCGIYGGLVMDFNEAERRFRMLDTRYRAGEIGPDEYQAQLYQLQVTDAVGRLWMMQQSTGRWYVFEEGRWRAGPPPGRRAGAEQPPLPPVPGRVTSPTGRSGPRWLAAGAVALAVLACAGLILTGVLMGPELIAQLSGTAEPSAALAPVEEVGTAASEAPEEPSGAAGVETPDLAMELTAQEMLPVAADGSSITDEAGTVLQVPSGAVPEGGEAQLEVYEPQGELFDALKETYVFETSFYAAAARGSDDGVGRATLRLPAAGSESRILTLIDEEQLVMLDVEPEAGVLTLNPRLGPSDGGEGEMVATLARGGTMRYAVVHPREGARDERGGPGHAASALQRDDPSRYCQVSYTYHSAQPRPVSGCRKNEDGSVFVTYPPELGLAEEANQVVDVAEAMVAEYRNLGGEGRGFAAAQISTAAPLYITLVRGGGNPYYKPANGVIYLPVDVAKAMGGEGTSTLYHEMAHWIQDEAYVMTWAFLWDEKVWWLETAAENMVMLVDPSYTAENLTYYGKISLPDSRLDFQGSPYDWRGDSYVQAQLVKLNMCDDASVCPISEASFKKAIDEGTYPFDDDAARQKLSANLDDYARYLLGATPERANAGILGGQAVRTGEGYGQSVQVARSQRFGDFWHQRTGDEPQVTEDTSEALEATVIDAALDKDGVYPLRVVSGYGGGSGAGLPAALRIAPGAPFYYRAGDGEVTFHDGKEELVIQPIHADMGFPSVRLVALGREGGEPFRARVEMIDLSGVWIFSGSPVSNNVTCSEEIADESVKMGLQPDAAAAFGVGIAGLGSAWGNYERDADGRGLTWRTVGERSPAELGSAAEVYKGSVVVKTDAVQVQVASTFDLSGGDQSRGGDPRRARETRGLPTELALLGLAPLALVSGWARAKGRGRILAAALVMVGIGALMLLTGCFGLDVYGTGEGEVTFTELAFVGGEGTATVTLGPEALASGGVEPGVEPLWVLRGGKGTFQVDVTTAAVTYDEEGNAVRSTRRCTGPVVYDMEAAIFEDVVLVLEE